MKNAEREQHVDTKGAKLEGYKQWYPMGRRGPRLPPANSGRYVWFVSTAQTPVPDVKTLGYSARLCRDVAPKVVWAGVHG
jgi:hypothetical protein